jgi:hypothetical protein
LFLTALAARVLRWFPRHEPLLLAETPNNQIAYGDPIHQLAGQGRSFLERPFPLFASTFIDFLLFLLYNSWVRVENPCLKSGEIVKTLKFDRRTPSHALVVAILVGLVSIWCLYVSAMSSLLPAVPLAHVDNDTVIMAVIYGSLVGASVYPVLTQVSFEALPAAEYKARVLWPTLIWAAVLAVVIRLAISGWNLANPALLDPFAGVAALGLAFALSSLIVGGWQSSRLN